MKKYDAILMIDSSEKNSDMYYAAGFLAPDPFVFIQTKREKIILSHPMEIERLKKESKADRIVGYGEYKERLEKKLGKENFKTLSVFHKELEDLSELLKDLKVRKIKAPYNFGISYLRYLEKKGFKFIWEEGVFFEERQIKTKEEIGYIQKSQQAAEIAMEKVKVVLTFSKVKNGYLHFEGKYLTSERLREYLQVELVKNGCIPVTPMIVSSGKQSAQPHNIGHGYIRAGKSIVVDIFPRSIETRYWGDMTRTFVKGKASSVLKGMYLTVLNAQKLGLSMIKEGASGKAIQEKVEKFFANQGFPYRKVNGNLEGYIHSFGHSVGLDIHENPGIGRTDFTLKAGNTVTAEPGLYYPDFGGVRIEDLVVVTKNGYRNLTKFPKEEFEL